jgi:hypothetical protein
MAQVSELDSMKWQARQGQEKNTMYDKPADAKRVAKERSAARGRKRKTGRKSGRR